ncbi:MAG: hypothetical protein KDD53_04805 [Bdellovibrionales bacterium]|nr:hypothetical protein [Bdellovibrionales bacterium]
MIETLKIDSEMTPTRLKKLARKLAMTGGYELEIDNSLSKAQITCLAERFLIEALSKSYAKKYKFHTASNAERILELLLQNPITPSSVVAKIKQTLS